MNLHEYQAKKILQSFQIPVPPFGVASSVEEAVQVAQELHLKEAVLKIQVHAGGRGKAGGVQFAKSREEIAGMARTLIGMKMVNAQTGLEGIVAKQILLSAPVDIQKEFYLSALVDRTRGVPVLIASKEGGMEIEEIARTSPEKILALPFSFEGTLRSYQLVRLSKFMGWEGSLSKKGMTLSSQLARCFMQTDASLVEINPLVVTSAGDLLALDAKISIDDNALFRHPDLAKDYDASQGSFQEAMAKEADLAYIAMHGNIGCMVNGAGLAMATMDIIQLFGGSPANFLDVGGGATKEKVAEGFRIILSDSKVKAILINIFGGIMNCATLAEGVIHAAVSQKIHLPLIVRLEGTNVNEGKKLFQASSLKILLASDLQEAAKLAVQAAKG